MANVGEITRLLRNAEAGREGAKDELWAAVYADLDSERQMSQHPQRMTATIFF